MINEMSVVERARALVDGNFAASMRKHAEMANRQLRRLKRAENNGDRQAIRKEQCQFLRSYAAKICAVVSNTEPSPELTAEILGQVAKDLDPFADPEEPVMAFAKAKSIHGEWRPICVFGLKRRSIQTLVGYVLDARFGKHPFDYMASGRGADIAADRIRELIDEGYEWFVLADIENCFGSVNPKEAAARLGLPWTMVNHCLTIGKEMPLTLCIPCEIDPTAFGEAVRQGISQGARSANRVMARLFGPEIQALAPSEHGMFYGDDVLLAAPSRKKAEAAAEALREMLASHPAGPFRLKRLEVAHIKNGFDYLKYYFVQDPINGHLKIHPTAKAYKKFCERVNYLIWKSDIYELYEAVMAYRYRWFAAFPRYKRTSDQEVQALNLLWQSAIENLPRHLRYKWDISCNMFIKNNKDRPGTRDDWLDDLN